ncbi:MAG: hypothetical protein HKN00_00500 [Flavobacteriaceae bacterium]|nr:hypothetical protein [Bacteroidia bacterium]NNF73635.1 hypothetical protein [Flavobacteriaceae bacterium]
MRNPGRTFFQLSIKLSLASFVLFLLFYLIAALNYPGGSYAYPSHPEFSFVDNYLCDLLDEQAINGHANLAKIYARISLGFLCFGILLFWIHIPELFQRKNKLLNLMRISGILSMAITVFLAAGNHDLITRSAGFFGAIALCLSFIELYRGGFKIFAYSGIVCLLLIALNFYSYETGFLRRVLPLFQKVTTVICLGWFVILNLKLYSKLKSIYI